MARENQGLQIALIVFVMLTIVLGVTTYLFFRNYTEAEIRAATNLAKQSEAAKLASKNEEDANALKKLIGVATTEQIDKISTGFSDDIKKYGSGYPDESKFYRPLLDKMQQTINAKNAELALAGAKIQKLEDDFRVREASKQPQIDGFKRAAEDAGKDLASERSKFKGERDRISQEEAKLKTDLENTRKEAAASLAKVDQKVQDSVTQNQALKKINDTLTTRQGELTAQKIDVPSGEVRWINQRSGIVWINLGRADSLQRQVTFSVYPSDITDLTPGSKKGSIEVTQILGDHLAEGRVFDDNLSDPITPGDKIFTPVWSPGEKRHFALAGFMDLDGDGTSDEQIVRDLITMNGGVIDSYIDDKGNLVGAMSVNTRYLVKGEAPSEKGLDAMRTAFTKMFDDAGKFGVQKIDLEDLLLRMGWKNQTPLVRFGRGANPKDFAAKPDSAVQKKSTGSVSDVFKPRVPPARVPSSGY